MAVKGLGPVILSVVLTVTPVATAATVSLLATAVSADAAGLFGRSGHGIGKDEPHGKGKGKGGAGSHGKGKAKGLAKAMRDIRGKSLNRSGRSDDRGNRDRAQNAGRGLAARTSKAAKTPTATKALPARMIPLPASTFSRSELAPRRSPRPTTRSG